MKRRPLFALVVLAALAVNLGCFFPEPEPGRHHEREHERERERPEREFPR